MQMQIVTVPSLCRDPKFAAGFVAEEEGEVSFWLSIKCITKDVITIANLLVACPRLFTIYIKNPSGFKLCKWNAKISIGKSRSEHALSISRKIGKNRKYIVKGLELDGKPRKMWMERNKPVETSQPVQEDNLFY